MEVKHTPGPWKVETGKKSDELFVSEDHDGYGGRVCRIWNGRSGREANANLIAAAPEMLKSLEWYADQFCELSTSHEACGKLDSETCSGCAARRLVSKATGGA